MTNIITIDDQEYNVDTFNDEQKALVGEAQFLQGELNRARYLVNMLEERQAGVIPVLKESLNQKESSLILPDDSEAKA